MKSQNFCVDCNVKVRNIIYDLAKLEICKSDLLVARSVTGIYKIPNSCDRKEMRIYLLRVSTFSTFGIWEN